MGLEWDYQTQIYTVPHRCNRDRSTRAPSNRELCRFSGIDAGLLCFTSRALGLISTSSFKRELPPQQRDENVGLVLEHKTQFVQDHLRAHVLE